MRPNDPNLPQSLRRITDDYSGQKYVSVGAIELEWIETLDELAEAQARNLEREQGRR